MSPFGGARVGRGAPGKESPLTIRSSADQHSDAQQNTPVGISLKVAGAYRRIVLLTNKSLAIDVFRRKSPSQRAESSVAQERFVDLFVETKSQPCIGEKQNTCVSISILAYFTLFSVYAAGKGRRRRAKGERRKAKGERRKAHSALGKSQRTAARGLLCERLRINVKGRQNPSLKSKASVFFGKEYFSISVTLPPSPVENILSARKRSAIPMSV